MNRTKRTDSDETWRRKKIDWTEVCTVLAREGFIKMRRTDHEFRADDRNITHVQGRKLREEEPIDAFAFIVTNRLVSLARKLLTAYKKLRCISHSEL